MCFGVWVSMVVKTYDFGDNCDFKVTTLMGNILKMTAPISFIFGTLWPSGFVTLIFSRSIV